MWYNNESEIFTHGDLGGNEIYPKNFVSSSYVRYLSSSPEGNSWYNTALEAAVKFDENSNGSFKEGFFSSKSILTGISYLKRFTYYFIGIF